MIIGISGNNGSGKDTFGMLLQAEYERKTYDVKRIAFADALYFVCTYIYGIPSKRECDKDRTLKDKVIFEGYTTRDILIDVGGKLREINLDTWVNIVKEEATHHDVLIVTDVRFNNEAAICDKLFQVIRDGCDENVGALYGDVIENNGTLDDLAEKAKEAFWIA